MLLAIKRKRSITIKFDHTYRRSLPNSINTRRTPHRIFKSGGFMVLMKQSRIFQKQSLGGERILLKIKSLRAFQIYQHKDTKTSAASIPLSPQTQSTRSLNESHYKHHRYGLHKRGVGGMVNIVLETECFPNLNGF